MLCIRKCLSWDMRVNFDFMVDLVSLGVQIVKNQRVQIFRPLNPPPQGVFYPPLGQNVNFIGSNIILFSGLYLTKKMDANKKYRDQLP